ncbi:hypothetical protein CERSUDRAFT_111891 [Gelatoporia subvermispora B]|uniref:P-loop containing nucleoside triphosphate hydrolase protein n=1 Tax=Ceriporiopsis subvermispora (strain B) TaxID=914234 RepID=M2R4T6_CERS8|nr:hypothetical protein CERSUDRAFT_111891 [Gelatoporia subvermispora B]
MEVFEVTHQTLNTKPLSKPLGVDTMLYILLIPSSVASVSAGLLLLQAMLAAWSKRRTAARSIDDGSSEDAVNREASQNKITGHIKRLGGAIIFTFRCARLFCCLLLLILFIYTTIGPSHISQQMNMSICATFAYATFLALLSVVVPPPLDTLACRHLATILVATWVVYAYRDIWPYATWIPAPADASEGWLLWIKLVLLSTAAIAIPGISPRKYAPLNAEEPLDPTPEQTASIFSLMFYFFMDGLVMKAWRTDHLPLEQFSPAADYDLAHNLIKRSYPHLDPFQTNSKRHLFWGLMKIFYKEYILLSLMIVSIVACTLASPIGINRLLLYIESGGTGTVVRPWVWVLWLFLAPTLRSCSFQWYIFTATRMRVRAEAMITSLIFDHSLRIRVKAESEHEGEDSARSSIAATPETTSVAEAQAEVESAEDVLDDDEETLRASSASGTSRSAVDKGKAKSSPEPEAEHSAVSAQDKLKNLVGKLNNLVTVDLDNITPAVDFLMLLELVPLQGAFSVWFLYSILSWSALVGLATMLVLSPIPGYIASHTQEIQKQKMAKTDARVQTATDTLNVFRMVKLFGWEPRAEEQLSQKRDEELKWAKKYKLLNLLVFLVSYVVPVTVMLTTFFTYTAIMKQALTASKVFPAMSAFELLADTLQRIWWNIPMIVQGKVSLERVGEFLHETELLDQFAMQRDGPADGTQQADSQSDVIGIRDSTFTWSDEDDKTRTHRRKFALRVIGELTFKRGSVNLIIGPTASGKTSLLMALLGEMHYMSTGLKSFVSLPRNGGVAYAAQESWVQNETIRDNILFGSPFDEERYNKVIEQCALKPDISLFDAGDKTEVGEKGITLSGGQKARLTLARAIYSSAQMLLLDDMLAALDVHTAKWIVDKCLKGDLVRGRTVILVTHNVGLAGKIADFVVAMSSDGRIAKQGSLVEVLESDPGLSQQMNEESKEVDQVEQAVDTVDLGALAKESTGGKLIVEEEIAVGHVGWSAMKIYLTALGGAHPGLFWLAFAGALFAGEIGTSSSTWFLGYWAQQYEMKAPSEVNVSFYIDIFAVMLFSTVATWGLAYVVWIFGNIRASRKIHHDLITSVLGSTLRWLDKTPVSRILVRCTQDINAVDGKVNSSLSSFLDVSATMSVRFAAVMLFSPLFIIPGSLVSAAGGFCGQMYMKAQLCVKREMSNAKAPVLGHFGATMTGLTSIRAYGAEKAMREESFRRINMYTRAAVPFYDLNRWICIRLDALGGFFVALLAAYLVYGKTSTTASGTGFSLAMAVSFSGLILWWIRTLNDVELSGNSLERIAQYLNIEHEPKPTQDGVPPAYWPASGDLRVEHLHARYSPDGPRVLHDISFEVKSGERIGIVGRTGSGKSSLTLALLRCIITEGTVFYDGIPTNSLNLDALRRNITIIPQVPELLSGTLRQNLDPFGEHDDAELHDALRAAGLYALQGQDVADDGRITLDTSIAGGGGNLSVGQRQILALARAIVRRSKFMILDEATSAIDYATDTVIQQSLRHKLGKDVTLLTVAHRLQTIMDADKIMVLDAGRIVEFDKPSVLLRKEKGLLRALVEESGDKAALYDMAEMASSST